MSPDGGVLLKGYSAYSLYYKTLLEKLDVNTHVFRVSALTNQRLSRSFVTTCLTQPKSRHHVGWANFGAYVDDVSNNAKLMRRHSIPTWTLS
ncbi:hypothetical protein OK016_03625 [Vibrio chagasii]|nr:hypothetical protein [Vibrio chagasii]